MEDTEAAKYIPNLYNYDKNFQPLLDNLDVDEKTKLEKLATLVKEDSSIEPQAAYAEKYNDATFLRYLRANKWNVDSAFSGIKATFEWRKDFKVHELNPDDFLVEGSGGKIFCTGFDKQNQPVLYMTPRLRNTDDWVMHIRIMVLSVEAGLKMLPPGVEKLALVVDLRGFGLKHRTPFSVSKELIGILGSHYPERLGVCIFLEAPWIFPSFFRIISPLLDPKTREKIIFSYQDKKDENHILNRIPDSFLPAGYGGKDSFVFKADTFFDSLKQLFN